MKVEIWSDIACPFCYIGKRKFEHALTKFSDKEDVEVVWKSYQLDPSTQHIPGMSIHDYLAQKKGFSVAQAKEMNDYVTGMADEVGLSYDFEKTVVANTFNAHRLIHLAAKRGLQDQAEESLFAAYFTRGKNIQDNETLIELGEEIGLDAQEVRQVLEGSEYADEVRKDFAEALKVGVRGVPFFLFNNKYAISGAQPTDVFSQVLEKVRGEEVQVKEQIGGFCSSDRDC